MSTPDDPWHWSVDDVVHAFCISRDLWHDNASSVLPDATFLTKALRENDINGSTLLTEVDKDFLKNDCSITSLGQRSSLLRAIDKLRDQSPLYLAEERRKVARQQSVLDNTGRPSVAGIKHDRSPGLPETPLTAERHLPYTPPYQELPLNAQPLAEVGVNARLHEDVIEDGNGRKRRKLNLATHPQPQDPSPNAKPGKQSPVSIKAASPRDKDYLSNNHLGEKIPVDDIFFGSTRSGQELKMDNGKPTPQEPLEDDEFDLSFVSRKAAGDRAFVANRMRHFLTRPRRQSIDRGQGEAFMIHPYPEHVKAGKGRPAVLLYEDKDGQVTCTRTSALQVEQGLPYDESVAGSDNQWDFLLHWQKNSKRGGESLADLTSLRSSEITEGLANELAEEGSEENDGLSAEDVSAIIDDTFDEFARDWNTVEGHKDDRKAWRIWQKDSRRLSRQHRIGLAKAQIQAYETRLRSHKIYILKDTYKTAGDVRRCCINSKLTIEMREQERFKIEVLKRLQPPRRPVKVRSKLKPKAGIAEDGGIIIDSESEDDLKDFLEDDSPLASQNLSDCGATASDLHHDDADNGYNSTAMDVDEPFMTSPTEPEQQRPPTEMARTSVTPSANNPSYAGNKRLSLGPASLVESVDEADIEAWSIADLEEESQRTKLLLKILLGLSADSYQSLRSRAIGLDFTDFCGIVQASLGAFAEDKASAGENHNPAEAEQALQLTRIFVAWRTCRYEHSLGVDQDTASALYSQSAFKNGNWIKEFRRLLGIIFARFPKPLNHMEDASKTTEDEDSLRDRGTDSDDSSSDSSGSDDIPPLTPKKVVKIDPKAVVRRQKARNREAQSQAATQRLFVAQSQDSLGVDDSPVVLVNVEEEDERCQVFIHPQIARKMQAHQIEGVRFLWREVITGATSEDGGEGCLLAHTMGLGKTMQTITFLVTLVETIRNREAVDVVPINLRRLRTLILCPASLIQNWVEEFYKWVPTDVWDLLGRIFTIDSTIKPRTRLQNAKAWASKGGTLFIGYELFRRIVHGDAKTPANMTIEEHKALTTILLDEPTLIIADEAHNMKNIKSEIFKCASRFKSKSRIALTGSPLANHLLEYFAMIDWASPGYLGTASEFRASYKTPIEEGLYKSSTRYAHRRALKKLNHLLQEIHPKVNRASITVLRGSLMPKVEFTIRLQLTDLQRDLYTAAVRGFQGVPDEASNPRLWSWLSLLLLINNHPQTFLQKLREKSATGKPAAAKASAKTKSTANEDEDDVEPDKIPLASSGLSRDAIQDLLEMLQKQPKLEDPNLSVKVALLLEILSNSIAVRDRTLVFSRSLLTLSYLEMALTERRIKYLRLDGDTKPTKRQGLAKTFNSEDYSVFLVSTTAGGTGFNLPGANRVVIFDFSFNPAAEDQAVGRAYRLGQTKPVFVYRFVMGGTFEDAIYEKAVFKTQLAYRTLEKKNIRRKALKTSEFLFPPKEVDAEVLDEHIGKDTAVLDKILDPARADFFFGGTAIRSIKTAEVLQQEAEDEKLTPEEEQEVAEEVKMEQMRRERPEEYQRRYAAMYGRNAYAMPTSAPMQSMQPVQTQTTFQPLPVQLPELEQWLLSLSDDRQKKVWEVAQKTQSKDYALIGKTLASKAWRVLDAVQHLLTFTRGGVNASAASSLAPGPVPELHSPWTAETEHGAAHRDARMPTPVANGTQDSNNGRSQLTPRAAQVPPVDSKRPDANSNPFAQLTPQAPSNQLKRSDTDRHAFTQSMAQAPSIQAKRPETAPALSSRIRNGHLPSADDPALPVKVETAGSPTPSTAPNYVTDGPVMIDLVSSDGEEPKPPGSSRQLKRFDMARNNQQRSDGAFDKKPIIAKGSSQAIYQSDGTHDVLLQSRKEKSPPISSQGWVKPRNMPPRH